MAGLAGLARRFPGGAFENRQEGFVIETLPIGFVFSSWGVFCFQTPEVCDLTLKQRLFDSSYNSAHSTYC